MDAKKDSKVVIWKAWIGLGKKGCMAFLYIVRWAEHDSTPAIDEWIPAVDLYICALAPDTRKWVLCDGIVKLLGPIRMKRIPVV